MSTASKYSPELREPAVRTISEHQGEYASQCAAIESIAAKIGCTTETPRKWVGANGGRPGSERRDRH